MSERMRPAVAMAIACLCLTGHAQRAVAQDVPDFLEVGKTYLFGVFGMMDQEAGAEVLEIGSGAWVKVRIEEMDQPIWLNLNMVAMVVELTAELEAFMEEERRSSWDRAYMAAMKSDLRNFVVAQEAYFADNLTYVDWTELPDNLFQTSVGVTIETIQVSDRGWSALARHESSDTVCYIYIGEAEPPAEGMSEGEPVCQ